MPTYPWLNAANRYIHPIGLRPGYGAVLLSKASFNKKILNNVAGRYALTFTATPANLESETVTFQNVRIVGTPIAVTPGVRDDEATAFFFELADRRIDCIGLCGKRYNWRIHADCTYETSSLNAGSAWTWTTLFTDLWNAVGNLGTFPTLPVTPVGVPDQIDGMGCRAADLLEDLLLLCGMAVKYNPSVDEFTIVSFSGSADGFFGSTTAQMVVDGSFDLLRLSDDKCIWNTEPISSNQKLPAYVRVIFPVWAPGGAPIDTASYYVVDVADTAPDASKLGSTTYALVQDFLPCRTSQQGTVLNGSDLVTRAAQVAANYFKVGRMPNFWPLHRIYSGIGQGTSVRPGIVLDVMVWEDIGAGPKTHVIQTGRLGFGPIFDRVGSLYASGSLLTGNPFGAATGFARIPFGSTNQKDPIQRVANKPPGELTQYGTGPMATASGSSAATIAGGGGVSSVMERIGPLRQWDAAVEARSVDGHGQRLWLAKKRTQHNCWVRVTSVTADGTTGYYPAIEVFFDPDKDQKDWDNGDVCWFWTPNSETPVDETRYWCYLQGGDGEASPKKVYMATPAAAAASATELKGLTFTSDTGSTADSDPGDGLFKWNNGTQSSATALYFDNQTTDGRTATTFWASLADTGFIYLQQGDDSTKWQMWKWTTQPTAGAGYYKFTAVTLQASSVSGIDDNKTVYTMFSNNDSELKGLTFEAETGSTSDADPGNGKLVWNNATQSIATFLYIDNLTYDAATASGFFAALGQTGFLYLQQHDDSSRWQMWKWALVTAGSGYYKFAVTIQANSASAIEDGKIIYTQWNSTTPRSGVDASPPPVGGPGIWIKFTKSYTDFSDASTSKTITLTAAAAKWYVHDAVADATTDFNGVGLGAARIDVGQDVTPSDTSIINNYSVHPTATRYGLVNGTGQMVATNSGAACNITITLTTTLINTNALTQGSIDIYLNVSILP